MKNARVTHAETSVLFLNTLIKHLSVLVGKQHQKQKQKQKKKQEQSKTTTKTTNQPTNQSKNKQKKTREITSFQYLNYL